MRYKQECLDRNSHLYCTWFVDHYRIKESESGATVGNGLTPGIAWGDAYKRLVKQ